MARTARVARVNQPVGKRPLVPGLLLHRPWSSPVEWTDGIAPRQFPRSIPSSTTAIGVSARHHGWQAAKSGFKQLKPLPRTARRGVLIGTYLIPPCNRPSARSR